MIDIVLYLLAAILLLLAGLGFDAGRLQLPWLAGAALVVSLLV